MPKQKPRSGVYGIFNTQTYRVYIGSSVNVINRWSWHLAILNAASCKLQKQLRRDWKKFGQKNFVFVLLEQVAPKLSKLVGREQFWMDAFPNKYNLKTANGSGYKMPNKTKAKLSAAAMKWSSTPEFRAMVSERAKQQHASGNFGRSTWDKDTVFRIADKHRKRMQDPVVRQKHARFLKQHIAQQTSEEMSRRSYCRKLFQEKPAK